MHPANGNHGGQTDRTWNKARAFALVILGVGMAAVARSTAFPHYGYTAAALLFVCGVVIYWRHVRR